MAAHRDVVRFDTKKSKLNFDRILPLLTMLISVASLLHSYRVI